MAVLNPRAHLLNILNREHFPIHEYTTGSPRLNILFVSIKFMVIVLPKSGEEGGIGRREWGWGRHFTFPPTALEPLAQLRAVWRQ